MRRLFAFITTGLLVLIPSFATTLADPPNGEKAAIFLNYYPSVFRLNLEESEYVWVKVQANGRAKVVLYGQYYWSDNISKYQGRLPKTYVRQLVNRTTEALSSNSSTRHYEGGPQDEEVFYLSILPLSQTFHQQPLDYLGLLETPRNVSDLIYELRTLWKRLEKARPAYAYLRVESVVRVSPQQVRQDLRFKPLQRFPQELRQIILAAVRNPLNFQALSRQQSDKFLVTTSSLTSFHAVIDGFAYRVTLYLPRMESPSTSKEPSIHGATTMTPVLATA